MNILIACEESQYEREGRIMNTWAYFDYGAGGFSLPFCIGLDVIFAICIIAVIIGFIQSRK